MPSLSEQELRSIRDELAAGATPTVWFTNSAVGIPEGRSGKVVSLDEPAEGEFIQVRPAGSKDVLSFSVAEVTQVKPARKRSASGKTTAATASEGVTTARAETASPAAGSGSGQKAGAAASSGKTGGGTPKGRKSNGSESSTTARSTASNTGKPDGDGASAGNSSANKAATNTPSASTASSSGKRSSRLSGATVTLTADETGQWTVEMLTGKKRSVRPTQVSPNAVAEATKVLHEDVAAAVEPLIDAAREQQRVRVEQLRAELASAEQALGELDH